MSADIGKLILRIMLGGMMLFHGIHKATHGIEYIKGLVLKQNLPEALAYGVYVGEIVAPLFLILGWKSRFWAGIIAFNMAVAIYLAHMENLLKLVDNGAWAIEVTMFYMLTAISIALLGSGKYSIARV